jgi:hypothetical protein
MARDEQIATDGAGLYYHLSQQSHLSLVEESGVSPVTGVTGDTEGKGTTGSAYLDLVAAAHRNGQLTTAEALELEAMQKRYRW